MLEGRQHNGHPGPFLSYFLPIKTGERRAKEAEKRGEDRKRKKNGEKIGGEKERKNREKKIKEVEEEEGAAPPAIANYQHRCLSLPAAPPMTAATAGQPFSPFFSPTSSLPCLHYSCSMWTVEGTIHTGWAEPSPRSWVEFGQAHAFGPGPAHIRKN